MRKGKEAPPGTTSLCRNCSWAQIITGYRESEKIVVCLNTYPNFVVSFAVRECTGYTDRNRPASDQTKKLAIMSRGRFPHGPVRFGSGDRIRKQEDEAR